MPRLFLPKSNHSIFFDRREPKNPGLAVNNPSNHQHVGIAGSVQSHQPATLEDCALIFMHHATGATNDWRDQLDYFSNHDNYHCLAYDRLGFGQSIPTLNSSEQTENSSSIMIDFPLDFYERGLLELAELVQLLNLKKIVLVGHSDGAALSLLAASGQGSNMRTNDFKVPEDTLELLKNRIVAVVAESPHMWYDPTCLEQGFQNFNSTVGKTDRFWSSTARDQLNMENAKQVVQRWQKLWLENDKFRVWDERKSLNTIECPVLVIHGQNDPFFPVDHSKFIANNLKTNEFALFTESAHTPHREQKALYNSTVSSFLRKNVSKILKFL